MIASIYSTQQSLLRQAHSLQLRNWQYYNGDTLQFWTGPKTKNQEARFSAYLQRVFHSYNILAECVDHYVNSLVSKPYDWFLVGTGNVEEAESLLKNWFAWNKRQTLAHKVATDPIKQAVLSMLVTGSGYLRLWSPSKYSKMASFQKHILHSPIANSVITERDNEGILYRVRYNAINGYREIYTLLDNGMTEIQKPSGNITLDLGGYLPLFELNNDCLLTESVLSGQNSINKTLTLKDVNLEYAGFVERVILNGNVPGKWVKDDSSPMGERFESNTDSVQMGPASINYVEGIPIGNPKNPTGYTTPQIVWRDPVDVAVFKTALQIDIEQIYMSMGLGHLLTAADGSISGRSRETLRQDFYYRLDSMALPIEAAIEGVLTVMLGLLGYTDLQPSVKLVTSRSVLSPDERTKVREEYESGLRSQYGAMSAIGIEEPDNEKTLMMQERSSDIELLAKPVDFVNGFVEDTTS